MSKEQTGTVDAGTIRVRRPQRHDELMSELTQADQPFDSLRDLLAYAAVLGWTLEKRTKFEQSADPIPWSVFANHSGNSALVDMFAVADTEDLESLSDENLKERVLRFEEYANTGLDALSTMRGSSSPIQAFARHIMQQKEGFDEPGIDELLSELSNQ